jgi:hypothetical protein
MFPGKPDVKEIVKGSGFGRIVKLNDSLRVLVK